MLTRNITRRFWIITFLLAGLALACSSLPIGVRGTPTPTSPPPTPTATPEPLPPTLLQADPAPQSSIGYMPVFKLTFNQPMNAALTSGAIRTEPALNGQFTWADDSTLIFSPETPILPNTQVKLIVDTGAQAANGLALQAPVEINYHTPPLLDITQELPLTDARDVDPTAAVMVTFNQPVVPLGSDAADAPAAFTLEPAAAGRGEWLNTSTYIFYPQPILAGNTQYSVHLNRDLQSLAGASLSPAAADWQFSTAQPKLTAFSPDTEVPWALDADITLTFNQPMDAQSVASNFQLASDQGNLIPVNFSWNDDFTVATVTHPLLKRSVQYAIKLDGQAASQGGTILNKNFLARVSTVGNLSIYSTSPKQGETTSPYVNITLNFTAPINTDNLDQVIHLDPKATFYSWYWDEDAYQLTLFTDQIQPNTDYTLTVQSDLSDAWGGTLIDDFKLHFTTEPPDPMFGSMKLRDSLFIDADNPQLSVQTASLTKINFSRAELTPAQWIEMQGSNSYDIRQSYWPESSLNWSLEVSNPESLQTLNAWLSPGRDSLEPGLYFLRAIAQQLSYQPAPLLLVVSHVQMVFLSGPQDAVIWATDLRTGQPVVAAPVRIFNQEGNLIASGQTDAQGMTTLQYSLQQDNYSNIYAMLGSVGEDTFSMASSRWDWNVEPYNFDISSYFRHQEIIAPMYTDRPVYRPGQNVHFWGIVRQMFDGRYSSANLSKLEVRLLDEWGNIIQTKNFTLSDYGTLDGDFSLAKDLAPGYYQLENDYDQISFQIANYRKPDVKLQVSFDQNNVLSGEQMQAQISAKTFFGAPVGNLPLKWHLYVTSTAFPMDGYQTGPANGFWSIPSPFWDVGFGTEVSHGKGQTDAQGGFSLTLKDSSNTCTPPATCQYTLEVTVDAGNGPVSARAQAYQHSESVYYGIHPGSWLGKQGQPLTFNIQATDWAQNPVSTPNPQVEFGTVTWKENPQWKYSPFNQPLFFLEFTPLAAQPITLDAHGQAAVQFTPQQAGSYLVRASYGNTLSESLVWVTGEDSTFWPSLPNQQIKLQTDQSSYQPGDTAHIAVDNPFDRPAPALIVTGRSTIMDAQVRTLPAGSSILDIPLSDAHAPNVYLSVTLLDAQKPDFRQGYLNLPVSPANQQLQVTLQGEPQRAQPGGEVTFQIQVSDPNGQPVQGAFYLSVVDQAALTLAAPNSKDILHTFYDQQPFGLQTGISMAAYGLRAFTQGAEGGLGGGGGEAIPPDVVREHFPDTAYWNGQITTDTNGLATVTVTLPDNLTTWVVTVRGLDQDTRVGEAEINLVSTKDLIIQPSAPRFLTTGDHTQLTAKVFNTTQSDIQAEVSLQSSGFNLDDPALVSQQIAIPAGGWQQVTWWGTPGAVDSIDLIFSVQGGGFSDAARPANGALPVLQYSASQTYATAGVLSQAGTALEVISLPQNISATGGELQVTLAPSLASALPAALDAIEARHAAHTEGLLSTFLPTLATYQALTTLGIDAPDLQAQLDRTLKTGLDNLLSRQNEDGGWGWWAGSPSQPYFSAYVLFGLSQAIQAGVEVPSQSVREAENYLLAVLPPVSSLPSGPLLDQISLAQYALTISGSSNQAETAALANRSDELSPWAQALLALNLESQNAGDPRVQTLLSNLAANAIQSATGAHWESNYPDAPSLDRPVFTSAVVLYAMAQHPDMFQAEQLGNAVRYLMSARRPQGDWESTYASSWAVLALTKTLQQSGDLQGQFAFDATLNHAPLVEGQAGSGSPLVPVSTSVPIETLYAQSPNGLRITHGEGGGNLYYSADLNLLFPADQALPLNQGIAVNRIILAHGSDCVTANCPSLTQGNLQQLVTVQLTVTLEQAARYLQVMDFIPAGAEILQTTLNTSQLGEAQPAYNIHSPFDNGWGWWNFLTPQIYDDHIVWAAEQVNAGTYTLTYTLALVRPGEYHVMPARAWETYFPEVQGTSGGTLFTISEP